MEMTELSKFNEGIDESWKYLVNIGTRKSGSLGWLKKEDKDKNK